MQIQFDAKEATIKLVYYGPALSGKTTNLRALHQITRDDSRGRLMTLETRDDRTLFFDVLPFVFRAEGASDSRSSGKVTLRIKIFTVPGQVLHASTRRLVLQGADGVAFIADSRRDEVRRNAESFLDLRENLTELGFSLRDVPLVIQFNKRDLPDVRPIAEVEDLARRGREPVYLASAIDGTGVAETFLALLDRTWNKLDAEHQLANLVGIGRDEFIGQVTRKLGIQLDLEMVRARALGGPRPPDEASSGAPGKELS